MRRPTIACVYMWIDVYEPEHVLYVGSTHDFHHRFGDHMCLLEKGHCDSTPFHRAMIQKYKNDVSRIDMYIVEEFETISVEKLREREAEYYHKLKPKFGIPPRTDKCYNRSYARSYYKLNKQRNLENKRAWRKRKQLKSTP
jgi:hypothetical protein